MNPKANRTLLYSLKRRYGVPISIVTTTTPGTYSPETGKVTGGTRTSWDIKRAIVFPPQMNIKFVFDLAYITSNRNFTSGAEFDRSEVWVIIDPRDIPGVNVNTKHYLIDGELKYNIYQFLLMQDKSAYFIKARHLDGELPYRALNEEACDKLVISDESELD